MGTHILKIIERIPLELLTIEKIICLLTSNTNIRRIWVKLKKDERGQGSAEYILLFGTIIIIAIVTLVVYNNYFNSSKLNAVQDVNQVRTTAKNK